MLRLLKKKLHKYYLCICHNIVQFAALTDFRLSYFSAFFESSTRVSMTTSVE